MRARSVDKVRWGILSTSGFAQDEAVPALQQSGWCSVVAIASRNKERARQCADRLGITTAYGSYEELLADPAIEVIYNPLPNSLHHEWSVKAAEAGKHVLCEKPIAMNAADAQRMLDACRRANVRIQEGFMIRYHPQWRLVKTLLQEQRIGVPRAVQTLFSYTNTDALNIRNIAAVGGGALYDIGCYCVVAARHIFDSEPTRAVCLAETDPTSQTDRLSSAILEFPAGHASFTCSTQLVPYQRVQILGTKGRIEVEIPFNAPSGRACRVFIDDGSGSPSTDAALTETVAATNQYVEQFTAFSKAIRENQPQDYPAEDAVNNMRVLDALFRSAETGQWERVAS